MKPHKTGILGGGQLSRFLALAAMDLGIPVVVLANSDKDPAALICPHYTDLREFLQQVDVVLFENEWIDTAQLRKAAEGLSVRFFPDLSVIERFQNKRTQKELLTQLGLPTAPWRDVTRDSEIGAQSVLKWATG